MNPEIWGPAGWIFLHCITLNYPNNPTEEDKKNFRNFFINLQDVLPCAKCRQNYKNHLMKFPLTEKELYTRSSLAKWLIDLHNEVNKLNGKEVFTYQKAVNEYFSDKNNNINKELVYLMLIILVIMFVFIIYMFRNRIFKK